MHNYSGENFHLISPPNPKAEETGVDSNRYGTKEDENPFTLLFSPEEQN